MTGDGVKQFFDAVEASREEYEKWVYGIMPSLSLLIFVRIAPADHVKHDRDYLPELQRARETRDKSLQDIKDDSMNRLMKDLTVDRAKNPNAALHDQWDPEEGDEEDNDDGDINIIDRSKLNRRLHVSILIPHDNFCYPRLHRYILTDYHRPRPLAWSIHGCHACPQARRRGYQLAKARINDEWYVIFKGLLYPEPSHLSNRNRPTRASFVSTRVV
jgi:hypothetical protein